jgi:hypothetical protein
VEEAVGAAAEEVVEAVEVAEEEAVVEAVKYEGDGNGGRESEAGKNRVHCGYTSLERFLFKGDVNPSTWVR